MFDEDLGERWASWLVSGGVFCLLYFLFRGHAWAIHAAILGAYSAMMLTYVLTSDYWANVRMTRWSELFQVLGLHLVYLLALFVWETFWIVSEPGMPGWVTMQWSIRRPAGSSIWDVVLAAGVGALIFSQLYFMRRILEPDRVER